jgi:hypothetical protein
MISAYSTTEKAPLPREKFPADKRKKAVAFGDKKREKTG